MGSVVVVWDRDDYIQEAEKKLGNKELCEEVSNDPQPLIDTIHRAVEKMRKSGDVSAVKYFIVKDPKFARFYLLPKIHKMLENVPEDPLFRIFISILCRKHFSFPRFLFATHDMWG